MTESDWQAIELSVRVTLVATVLFFPVCVGLGVWLGRTRSRLRRPVQAVAMLPMVLPPVVTGLLLLKLFQATGLPLAFTWYSAVIASGLVAAPLWIRTVRATVETLDPRLGVVAASLGASAWRRFITITMPLAWKGVVGGAVLFVARALGEFGAVMVVAGNTPGSTQTIPLAIYGKLHSPAPGAVWPLTIAAVVLSLIATGMSELLVSRRPRL